MYYLYYYFFDITHENSTNTFDTVSLVIGHWFVRGYSSLIGLNGYKNRLLFNTHVVNKYQVRPTDYFESCGTYTGNRFLCIKIQYLIILALDFYFGIRYSIQFNFLLLYNCF